MRLTAFTNYALRTLMFACLREGRLSQAEEVALAHGIAPTHVIKCVHRLGQWGYLENVRGRNGGFRLARPAAEITVGEIVRLTEDGLQLVECFDPATNTCPLCGVCHLSTGIQRALGAFLAVLDGLTIADVSRNRAALLDRLLPAAAEPEAAGRL